MVCVRQILTRRPCPWMLSPYPPRRHHPYFLATLHVFVHFPHRSKQISKVYGREMYTALVGAPGQAVVYVFEYNVDTGEWDEVQVRIKNQLMFPAFP